MSEAPFALTRIGPDARLNMAERKMRHLLDEGREQNEPDAALTHRWKQIGRCFEIINGTAPTTLAGCAVKLRLLANPEVGMEISYQDDDFASLGQVLAFIERQVDVAE